MLIDNHALRIAAPGAVAGIFINAVVGRGKPRFTVLFFVVLAEMALAAGVDHHAHADDIAGFKMGGLVPDLHDSPDYLVSRHQWILADRPFVTRHMEIGVAHAAIKDLDFDILLL